jgi:AcrR family transcriptional regulator
VPKPIWLRPEPGRRNVGRPAAWNRRQIVDAALALADREGLAAVTTRRVAAELGTASASLYRHVPTRADLLDLMVDRALARYRPPAVTGDWRADIVAEHLHRLAHLRARPWLVDAILERPPTGPAAIGLLEHTLEQLRHHPARGQAKLEAVGVLSGMLQTYLRNERPGAGVLDPEFVAARAELFARAAGDGAHPRLAEVLADLTVTWVGTVDDELGRVLGLVLDGLLPVPPPDAPAAGAGVPHRPPGPLS